MTLSKQQKLNEIYESRYLYGKLDLKSAVARALRKNIQFYYIDLNQHTINPKTLLDYTINHIKIREQGDLIDKCRVYFYIHNKIDTANKFHGINYNSRDEFVISKEFIEL